MAAQGAKGAIKQGKGADVKFESDAIRPAKVAAIKAQLARAETAEDVDAGFRPAA